MRKLHKLLERQLRKSGFEDLKPDQGDSLVRLLESVSQSYLNYDNDLQLLERSMERQTQTLAAASKMSALGEMAAGIAHEINNPLATIRLSSEQLVELLDENPVDSAAVKDICGGISSTVMRIAKIVSGLKNFSRDGSQDGFEETNIRKLIDETLDLCQERFRYHGVRLAVECPDELIVECQGTQISQVLLNLLNNAHDAIQELSEKWILVRVVDCENEINVCIVDSGHGIPREIVEKIFQPFFTTKAIGKGTGLGLSISMGIVSSHGGHLEYRETDQHTGFQFRIPKVQSKREDGAA